MTIPLTVETLWLRAAQRALAAALHRQVCASGTDSVLVPRTSGGLVAHRVQLANGRAGQCDCEASLAGRPCKHRAAVALRLLERATNARVVRIVRAQAILPYLVLPTPGPTDQQRIAEVLRAIPRATPLRRVAL